MILNPTSIATIIAGFSLRSILPEGIGCLWLNEISYVASPTLEELSEIKNRLEGQNSLTTSVNSSTTSKRQKKKGKSGKKKKSVVFEYKKDLITKQFLGKLARWAEFDFLIFMAIITAVAALVDVFIMAFIESEPRFSSTLFVVGISVYSVFLLLVMLVEEFPASTYRISYVFVFNSLLSAMLLLFYAKVPQLFTADFESAVELISKVAGRFEGWNFFAEKGYALPVANSLERLTLSSHCNTIFLLRLSFDTHKTAFAFLAANFFIISQFVGFLVLLPAMRRSTIPLVALRKRAYSSFVFLLFELVFPILLFLSGISIFASLFRFDFHLHPSYFGVPLRFSLNLSPSALSCMIAAFYVLYSVIVLRRTLHWWYRYYFVIEGTQEYNSMILGAIGSKANLLDTVNVCFSTLIPPFLFASLTFIEMLLESFIVLYKSRSIYEGKHYTLAASIASAVASLFSPELMRLYCFHTILVAAFSFFTIYLIGFSGEVLDWITV